MSYTVEQGLVLWPYIREITSSIPSDKVMVILFSAKPAGTGQLFTLNWPHGVNVSMNGGSLYVVDWRTAAQAKSFPNENIWMNAQSEWSARYNPSKVQL